MKAGRAVDLGESAVEPWGLAGDRRWLLVDEDGRFVSQREESALARVVVRYGPAAGAISVSADGLPARRIDLPAQGAQLLKVTVWDSALLAAAAGPAADQWFRAYLGRPVRLVYLDDPTRRPVDPEPLKMLGLRRRFGQELVFGQNLIPDSGGVIRAGDAVEVLQTA